MKLLIAALMLLAFSGAHADHHADDSADKKVVKEKQATDPAGEEVEGEETEEDAE